MRTTLRSWAQPLVLAGTLAAATGCFRTVYHNLEPTSYQPTARVAPHDREKNSSWQHFFIYGWAPSERVIDAAARCGGPMQVQEIRTEQSFGQGLIATFAGYYINIYSPYTGEVVCAGDRRE
jgi:hypothetical protein